MKTTIITLSLILTGLIFLALFQINLINHIRKIRLTTGLMASSMIYYVVVAYRIDFGQLHPYFFINNPLIANFLESDTGFFYYWFK